MCYSAQVEAGIRAYTKAMGARVDTEAFVELYERRDRGEAIALPRALDIAMLAGEAGDGADGVRLRGLAEAWEAREIVRLEREAFAQATRLADAERRLAARPSKAAAEEARIATAKRDRALARLAPLRRREARPEDARIFPKVHAPVLVVDGGTRWLRPMRYQCRPAGKPADLDARFPGTYNARRDNLRGFWRGEFGRTHGLVLVHGFFEHVALHDLERRALAPGEPARSVVIEFRPGDGGPMPVACLWSPWRGAREDGGEDALDSFAIITDDPPPEVAAAGHDRCPVRLDPARIDDWLQPARAGEARVEAALAERPAAPFAWRRAAA